MADILDFRETGSRGSGYCMQCNVLVLKLRTGTNICQKSAASENTIAVTAAILLLATITAISAAVAIFVTMSDLISSAAPLF
jgi:hypothetical protein